MAPFHTFVIAEAACTWRYGGRDLENACQSIKVAKDCGADAWKTQWVSDGYAMAKRRGNDNGKAYADRLGFHADWLPKIKDMCDKVGIEFMCTVFLPQDVDVIEPLVKRFKVASYEAGYKDLVEKVSGVETLVSWGPNFDNCTGVRGRVLYCIPEYPCPMEMINLSKASGIPYSGFSDHTTSIITGAMAVTLGKEVVEKHFKLDGTPREDADYWHSLTPAQLKQYIANIREAEIAL